MPFCHDPHNYSGSETNRKPDPDGLGMYKGGKVNIVMKNSAAKSRNREAFISMLLKDSEDKWRHKELKEGKLIRLFKGYDWRSKWEWSSRQWQTFWRTCCLPNRHRVHKWGSSCFHSFTCLVSLLRAEAPSLCLLSKQRLWIGRRASKWRQKEQRSESRWNVW